MARKNEIIISQAAATRFFMRISSMNLSYDRMAMFLEMFTLLIAGKRTFEECAFDFYGSDGSQIGREVWMAINRSARARAAAARRKAKKEEAADTSVAEKVDEVMVEYTEITSDPPAQEDRAKPSWVLCSGGGMYGPSYRVYDGDGNFLAESRPPVPGFPATKSLNEILKSYE